MNTPLAATVSGTVVYAGMGVKGSGYGGYGNVVAIKDSSGNVHLFAHMNSVNVKAGQTVQYGQLVGKSGNTGDSTGAHLHYEIRKNGVLGNTIDPTSFLNGLKGQSSSSSSSSSSSGNVQVGGVKPWINSQAGSLASTFKSTALRYGVDPYILMAMSMQESSMGKTTGKNIMEANGGVAGGGQFNSYADSIEAGTKEFAARFKEAGGDVKKALAAYNMGAGILKWFNTYSGGKYSADVVKNYSAYYAKKYGWRRYGDVNYVDHVLQYYR